MMDEKEELINDVIMTMNLDTEQSKRLKNIMNMKLYQYSVTKIKSTDISVRNESLNEEIWKMFFIAKRIQGCTDRTLCAYKNYLSQFFRFIDKDITQVTTNDIRFFMATKKEKDHNSDTNVNNFRRILSSFFTWCAEEEYISKNPMARIKKVRQERYVKKSFKEMEIERLRNGAKNDVRLTALLEFLLSTGCRISEVENANREDLEDDELVVHGKGKKDRYVYLNAKARIALENYLKSRDDDNKALFVSLDKPHDRLKTTGMGIAIRELGKRVGVTDTHPHRFRRTAATMALNRGMPIDQVQQMLGHSNIETTTIYAVSAQETVKANHKKYVV